MENGRDETRVRREPTRRDVASLFHKRKLFRARDFRKDFVAWNDAGFQEKRRPSNATAMRHRCLFSWKFLRGVWCLRCAVYTGGGISAGVWF